MFKKRGQVKDSFFHKNKLWIAITTLIGTIVGAGILAIPYTLAKAGFFYGLIIIVLLGLAFLFLNLYVGEIVLRTKEQHQLTGYMEIYLGKWGKYLMAFSMIFGLYGALIAYIIGEGAALKTLFGFGHPLIYSLIFFTFVALIIIRGIKATGKAELIVISLLVFVVIFIGIFSFQKIAPQNFTLFNPLFFFLPYGVVLFAFMGSVAIPEIQEELGQHKKLMKKAIIIGSLSPILIYLLFSFIIVGVVDLGAFESLSPNERIATIALGISSAPLLGILANFLAVCAMFTSFLTIGTALVEMYHYDFGISRRTSLLLVLIIPLLIAVANLITFVAVIGLAGAVAGGLDGILIVLAYWKVKRLGNRIPEYSLTTPKLLGYLFIIMFALGIIYQIFTNFF